MMLTKKAERIVGISLLVIIALLLLCAYMSNEVPSSEIKNLTGVRWFLFWSLVLYLPIFPLISMFLAMPTAQRPIEIFSIQTAITGTITAFAWLLDFQSWSWTFLLLANIVLICSLIIDSKNYQKR